MASVNNVTCQRKKGISDSDIIYELNEDDCSQSSEEGQRKKCLDSKTLSQETDGSLFVDSGISSQESLVLSENFEKNDIQEAENTEIEQECVSNEVQKVEIVVSSESQTNGIVDEKTDEIETIISIVTSEDNQKVDEVICITQVNNDVNTVNEISNVEMKDTIIVKRDVNTNTTETENIEISNCVASDGELLDCDDAADGIEPVEDQVISINFKNDEIASSYKSHFTKFLRSFPELRVLDVDELRLTITRDINVIPNDWVVIDEDDDGHRHSKPKKRKKSKPKSKKELFMVDTEPSLSTRENDDLRYSSKFAVIDNIEDDQDEEKKKKVSVSTQTCFNCGGNHSLKDCTMPKNYAKINAAKQKFRSQQNNKGTRYHLDSDQMYAHLVPGKLSEDLRKALGLRKYDLPPHIYKMRMLGYPPGWIEEAQNVDSNLSMFDADGNSVSSKTSKKSLIDPEKIIDYPGFNAPMEPGVWDDFRFFGVPPFSSDHSKEAMINFINKIQEKNQDNLEECSMDLESSVSEERLCEIVTNVNESSRESPDESVSNREDSSLAALEIKKKELLAELDNDTNSDSLKVSPEESSVISNATQSPIEEVNKLDTDKVETCSLNDSLNVSVNERNVIKTSCFGTPVLKSASPYSKLPKPDNFSLDISPVINFENLPNSTGKYEKMTGVLHKVRTALKDLQKEKTGV